MKASGGKQPSAQKTYQAIKERILGLELKPGEMLSEMQLANLFQVSRTPVREALIKLNTEGLVDIVPQLGTFVAPIRRGALMNAQYAREALEVALAEDAARLRRPQDIVALEQNLAKQQAAVEQRNNARLFELDEELHQLIASAAGRPDIWLMVKDIKIHMDRIRRLGMFDWHVPDIIVQHRRMLDAIAKGSKSEARRAMRDHLRFVIDNFDMISAQKPEYTHDWLEEAAGNWNRPNNPGHTSFKPDSSRGKLSKEQRRKIIEAHNSGRSTGAQLAKEYGVSPATVSRLIAQHR